MILLRTLDKVAVATSLFMMTLAIGASFTPSAARADGPAAGSAFSELNAAQQAAVQSGQQVYFDQSVAGSPWPKMFLYQLIDCTPEQAEAVTIDWTLHTVYTPNLKSAQVSLVVSPTTTQVDYVLSMGILGDEPFTLSNTLSTYDGGTSYRNDWNLVRAKRTKTSTGFSRFEPLGSGTLMAITSFIDPGSSLAGLVTGTATQDFKNTATGFIGQIGKEIQSDPTLMQQQIQVLSTALGN